MIRTSQRLWELWQSENQERPTLHMQQETWLASSSCLRIPSRVNVDMTVCSAYGAFVTLSLRDFPASAWQGLIN